MEKYLKYLFFLFFIFVFLATPKVFAAEVEQAKTINSSIGKFSQNILDDADMPLDVSNSNMTVGGGNYYYLGGNTAQRTSYFRRYFTNLTTNIVNGTSYHVRIVFLREPSISFSPINNRCLDNKASVQINGTNASNVSGSITRESSSNVVNGVQLVYDRFDIYFTANVTSNNLSISLGELTSCSFMYWNSELASQDEHDIIGVNGIYVWNNAVNSGTNEQDMIAQQKQSNTFLGSIQQKISDFQTMVHNLLEDIKEKIDDFKNSFVQHITNFKYSMEQRIDDLKNFFSGSSIDENDVNDFFDSLEFYDNDSLGGVITAPVNFITHLGTNSCSPITLYAWDSPLTIPCGDTLFWSRTGYVWSLWSIVFGGVIIYRLAYKLFKVVNDAVDPTKDDIGGLEV